MKESCPRVLLLGGTSFIGRSTVRQLRHHGCSVAVFHRGEHEAEDEPKGVHHIHGERSRITCFRDEFAEFAPDVIVDMRAMTEDDARSVAEVLTGIAERAVLISSMDVYRAFDVLRGQDNGNLQPVPFSEVEELRRELYPYRSDPPRANNDPQKWMDHYDKILVERIFLGNEDMSATVLRLPAVYGPWDRQRRFLAVSKRIHDGRHVILLNDDLARWQFMHAYVDDVGHAITLAALDRRAGGEIYNVGEQHTPPTQERLRQLAEVARWEMRIVVRPGDGKEDGYNFAQDVVGDTRKIRAELGYKEQTDLNKAIRKTVEWESANQSSEFDPSAFDYKAEDRWLAGAGRSSLNS